MDTYNKIDKIRKLLDELASNQKYKIRIENIINNNYHCNIYLTDDFKISNYDTKDVINLIHNYYIEKENEVLKQINDMFK